jgi:plasmid stabilization system protein ParE
VIYRLEIRPDAIADIEEAALWYEAREPSLGSDFADAVLQAIDTLPNNRLAYRIRHKRKNFDGNCSTDFRTASSTELPDTLLRS